MGVRLSLVHSSREVYLPVIGYSLPPLYWPLGCHNRNSRVCEITYSPLPPLSNLTPNLIR